MQNIMNTITGFEGYIILALVIIILIVLTILLVVLKSISRLESKYRRLMRGVDNKNLEELITGYLDKIDKSNDEVEGIKQLYDNLDKKVNACVQKVSMIRYRAFEDVGSDLSFSIALLNGDNDGVIVTGIYGRNESTCYAKPIDKGMSRYDLSHEEKEVLQDCIDKNLK